MAIRNIVKEGDDVLRKKARPVEDFGSRTQRLIDDMVDTLYGVGNGIGLAAPQVGVLKRIFVIDLKDGDGLYVFVNPEIVETQGSQTNMEGCLSIPGKWGEVERPEKVKVKALDREGSPFEVEAEGLFATCICHENDHLDGILFRDKVKGALVSD